MKYGFFEQDYQAGGESDVARGREFIGGEAERIVGGREKN